MQLTFIDLSTNNSDASRRELEEAENNVVDLSNIDDLNKEQQQRETKTKTATRKAESPKVPNYCRSSRATLANTPNETDMQASIASQVAGITKGKKKNCSQVALQESEAKDNDNGIIIQTASDILLEYSTSKKLTNLSRELIKSAAYVYIAQFQFQYINYCYSY